jgi:hypothetical protein
MTGAKRSRPAVSFCPSDLTAPNKSHRAHLGHPERTPDFLLRCSHQRPRMRLSLRKAARGLPTPLSLTGNLEEAEGSAVLLPYPLGAGCLIQARFWLEWDTTALDAPFFVIPRSRGTCGSLVATVNPPWANRLRVPFLHQRKLQIPPLRSG